MHANKPPVQAQTPWQICRQGISSIGWQEIIAVTPSQDGGTGIFWISGCLSMISCAKSSSFFFSSSSAKLWAILIRAQIGRFFVRSSFSDIF